jgi:hypothetical protein
MIYTRVIAARYEPRAARLLHDFRFHLYAERRSRLTNTRERLNRH